jgi:competence protein ComEA
MQWCETQIVDRFSVRRGEQATVAVIAVMLAGCWLGSWIWRGGWSGRLARVEHESARVVFVVDINRAQWPELASLPRIGETLAKRIIEVRKREGPYRSVDELQKVHGIGVRTVDRIRPYVKFERPTGVDDQ